LDIITETVNSKVTRFNLLFIIIIILLTSALIICSFIYNFNENSSLKRSSDFTYFYHESKIFFADKNFYSENYNENYAELAIKDSLKPLYPPIIYFLYLPFSYIPYNLSFLLYTLINLFLYFFAINLIISYFKRLTPYRFLILMLSLLFPPFIYVLINGHISVLWVIILILSFYLAKKDKIFSSGAVLSLFLFKPSFFIIIFIILFLSFKGRLFLGLILGSLFLIILSGITSGFGLWADWLNIVFNLINKIFYKDIMYIIKQNTSKVYFYPMKILPGYLIAIEYAFTMTGLFSIIMPIIYSFNHNKDFSRNSFWFIFTLSFVLACPYLYNYELIILIFPLIIFINLMLADRVRPKFIIFITSFFIALLLLLYFLSIFIYVQLLALVFWFFIINSVMGKRIKNYMPKNYIDYWGNY